MKANNSYPWLLSIILSVMAIGVISYKWRDIQKENQYGKSNCGIDTVNYASTSANSSCETCCVKVVFGNPDLKKIGIDSAWENCANADSIPELKIKIPTGFFIQSIRFQNPYEINFSGYIWQKYCLDFPDSFKPGIIFPEEINSSSSRMDTVYYAEEPLDNPEYKLICWYFDVTVRQIFDYSNYPFDNITAWLRIWSKDFNNDERIFLIPDFDSYHMKDSIFGLDQDIVDGEWQINKTFFSYHNVDYNTNFGFSNTYLDEKYNELYINLGLHRSFIDAIVLNLIPLFVVALLLFAQIMTFTNQKKLIGRFGFNTSVAIGTCSALFFIVLLAHIQVRQQFLDSPLVYIEYFYLIMYVFILLTALNAFIFPLGKQKTFLNLIYYRDNLVPKIAFWPMLLWMVAIVALIKL